MISECQQCTAGVPLHLVRLMFQPPEEGETWNKSGRPVIVSLHEGDDITRLSWYGVRYEEILD